MWIEYGRLGRRELLGRQFASGTVTVGRQPDAGICLESAGVSSIHLYLQISDGRAWVMDNQSTNGTAINNRAIGAGEWVELRPSDTIHIPDYWLRCMIPLAWPPALDGDRYCYLRESMLHEALADERVLDKVAAEKCAGKWPILRASSPRDRWVAVWEEAHHQATSTGSPWNNPERQASEREVIAAWAFECAPVRRRDELFSAFAEERNLTAPVAAWLQSRGWDVYDEVFVGGRRSGNKIDLLAVHGDLSNVVAFELKNSHEEIKKAPKQISVYCQYAHEVYLGCSPMLAAEFVYKKCDRNHWDAEWLNRWLAHQRSGLILVERSGVYFHKAAERRLRIESDKLAVLRRALSGRAPLPFVR